MRTPLLSSFLGLLLLQTDAFVLRSKASILKLEQVSSTTALSISSTSIGDFITTVDIASLSLTSPGIKEFVLFLTPLSALAGTAVVQTRRKQFTENMESTQMAMNETQTMLLQSSNNFKIYTGLAIASFAVVAISQFGLLPSSFTNPGSSNSGPELQMVDRSLRGFDYFLFTVPIIAFAGGAFFKFRSDKVFENIDATKKALNETQTMILESQNRGKMFQNIAALSFSIVLLSQLGFLEFVSFSSNNPATYQMNPKETTTTTSTYKSLDSLQPPELDIEKGILQSNENKQTNIPDSTTTTTTTTDATTPSMTTIDVTND